MQIKHFELMSALVSLDYKEDKFKNKLVFTKNNSKVQFLLRDKFEVFSICFRENGIVSRDPIAGPAYESFYAGDFPAITEYRVSGLLSRPIDKGPAYAFRRIPSTESPCSPFVEYWVNGVRVDPPPSVLPSRCVK